VTVAVLTVIVGNCNCELQSINQSINQSIITAAPPTACV